LEDGRWIWKSREDWPDTIVKLDEKPLQAVYDCEKCRRPITQPPYYRVLHKIPIWKGYDGWLWVMDGMILFIALKKLRFTFHQYCYDYSLVKKHEFWWIP